MKNFFLAAATAAILAFWPLSPKQPPLVASLPNPTLTPGDTDAYATEPDPTTGIMPICVPNFAGGNIKRPGDPHPRPVRNVPPGLRKEVFIRYGLGWPPPEQGGPYEVDHLISLQLGGSNDIKNLWPLTDSDDVYWNKKKKDRLESHLKRQVCQKGKPVTEAQRELADNWIQSYLRYFD